MKDAPLFLSFMGASLGSALFAFLEGGVCDIMRKILSVLE